MQDLKMRVSQISRITGEDGEALTHTIRASGCLRGDLLTFTEAAEDGARVFHRIDMSESGALTVARTGAVVSRVRFAEGERDSSIYRIPPYAFDMEVVTERLSVERRDGEVRIALAFRSELGGSKQRTELSLEALPREDGT